MNTTDDPVVWSTTRRWMVRRNVRVRCWADRSDGCFLRQGYWCGLQMFQGRPVRFIRSAFRRPVRLTGLQGVYRLSGEQGLTGVLRGPVPSADRFDGRVIQYVRIGQWVPRRETTVFVQAGRRVALRAHDLPMDPVRLGMFLLSPPEDKAVVRMLVPHAGATARSPMDSYARSACRVLADRVALWQARLIRDPGDRETLHQFRVALRKLRGVLSYTRDDLSADGYQEMERYRRRFQWYFRLSSPIRDLDICLMHLENRDSGGVRGEGAAQMGELQQRRDRLIRSYMQRVKGPAFRQLCVSLRRFVRKGREQNGLTPVRRFDAHYRSVVQRQWSFVAQELPGVGQMGPGERHRLRIRMKKLRYWLEFCLPGLADELVRDLAFGQELLGEWLDGQICRELLSTRTRPADGTEDLIREMDEESVRLDVRIAAWGTSVKLPVLPKLEDLFGEREADCD